MESSPQEELELEEVSSSKDEVFFRTRKKLLRKELLEVDEGSSPVMELPDSSFALVMLLA